MGDVGIGAKESGVCVGGRMVAPRFTEVICIWLFLTFQTL